MKPTVANLDLCGRTFSRLTPIRKVRPKRTAKDQHTKWYCTCSCGNSIRVRASHLLSGEIKSCGCYRLAIARSQHTSDLDLQKNALWHSYRIAAKKRKLSFGLNIDDIWALSQQRCFYCGVSPSNTKRLPKRNLTFLYNGIDRVDNTIGYLKNNCVPACKTCNFAKHEMAQEDFTAWIRKACHHLEGHCGIK